jgi:hypothetical protein
MTDTQTCPHSTVKEVAIVWTDFDGGEPPPLRKEDHRPIGKGYTVLYVGDCQGCGQELYHLVIQRYNTSPVAPSANVRIPWTAGRLRTSDIAATDWRAAIAGPEASRTRGVTVPTDVFRSWVNGLEWVTDPMVTGPAQEMRQYLDAHTESSSR